MLSSKVAGKIFDAEIMYFFREHVLVFHCPYDNLFTAESQRAQSEFSFSFAAETRLRIKLRRAKRRQMKSITPLAI
jgi:hypothetical protein